jgi:DNA-binding winged helix-turn-helix (wHTH) protein
LIRFGVFEANLETSELRKRGVRIKIQEQPFQILAMLLERRGQVVTRDELHKTLWGAHTFVDFERGLNKAINPYGQKTRRAHCLTHDPHFKRRFMINLAR